MEFGPIQYGMLNPYEANILSRRPLRRGDVYRLYRSTLQRFLHGNGMQSSRNEEKNVLVDMVFHLTGEEDSVNMPDWHSEQSMPHLTLTSTTYTYEQIPPSEPCSCHECEQSEPPVAPSEDMEDHLQTCQAQFNMGDYYFDDEDDEYQYFTDASECYCSVPISKLLENVNLSADSENTFMSMTESPAKDLIQLLQNFGVEVDNIGCRVHLLMMLRDLLDEQGKVIGETTSSDQSQAVSTPVPDTAEASVSTGPEQVARLTQDFSRLMMESLTAAEETTTTTNATATASTSEVDPMRECCICLQNPREIAFVPCGHALCCRTCARKLRGCPVCRKKVQRRLKLYFS